MRVSYEKDGGCTIDFTDTLLLTKSSSPVPPYGEIGFLRGTTIIRYNPLPARKGNRIRASWGAIKWIWAPSYSYMPVAQLQPRPPYRQKRFRYWSNDDN